MRRGVPFALAPLILLGGCAVGPANGRPDLETTVPVAWASAAGDTVAAERTAEVAADRWWEAIGDASLDLLVADALAYNPRLDQAAARVLQARATARGAGAALWPTVEGGASASRTKTAETVLLFGPLYTNTFGMTATARWEADLWGRLSRAEQAAAAALLAAEHNRRAVAQGLVADVVRTWLAVRELQLQVALTERTIASYEDSVDMVRERYRRGLVGPLDLHLVEQNLASARAQLPAFSQQLAVARRTLEILVGRYPAGRVAVDVAAPGTLTPVPAGLPSALLERRPDLLAAEAQLASAVASIGQAKAALYPRLSLTAEGGSRSRELGDLLTAESGAWSLVGNLVLPLINRGATISQVRAAEARAREAAAAYRQAVLQAFAEVENALDQDRHQGEREARLAESVVSARGAVDLAEDRYRRGLDNLLTTLEAQRRLFAAESSLLTSQRERSAARVDLIQALGGAWNDNGGILP